MPFPPAVMLFIAMVLSFSAILLYVSISDAMLEKSLQR